MLVTMWKSILRHIVNVHDNHGEYYPKCLHEDLINIKWITEGKIYFT